MFPEITRDEVFRIETRHLWLRWPICGDADALVDVAAQTCRNPELLPDGFRTLIAGWRAEMEAGHALHLVLAPKDGGSAIGVVHAKPNRSVRCRLLPGEAARPFGAEAVEAVQTMITWLVGTPGAGHRRPWAQQYGLLPRAALADRFAAPA